MLIRPATDTDFDQWLPLWRGYQAFYRVDIPPETTRLTWARMMDDREPMHCAVAESDGRLAGLVHYIFHRSCWTQGDYVYLQDLYALPERRGQGVGRALIEHVYRAAADANAARVHWLTHESNAQAMRLYDQVAEKSGFVHYRKVLG